MALGRITTQATAVRTQPLYICQAGDLWACRKVEVQKKKKIHIIIIYSWNLLEELHIIHRLKLSYRF